MMNRYTPRPEQEAAIMAILRDRSHLCKAEGGAGKTLVGVEAFLRSGSKTLFVIAPLNTFSSWRDTITRQSTFPLELRQIRNDKAGNQAHADLLQGVPGAYFIGWQYFRNFSWNGAIIDFAIADEGHRMQNRKSATALKVIQTLMKPTYKLYLSATPAGNHMKGMWTGIKWLWPDHTPAFWTWVSKYFHTEHDDYSGKKVLGEIVPQTIWRELPSKSYFPSPFQAEPIIHEIIVKMTPAQQKLYNRFEAEAVAWLEDHPLVANLPVVQAMRLREMTLAVPSIRFEWKRVSNEEVMDEDFDWTKWEMEERADGWYANKEVIYFKDDAKSSKADAVLEVLEDLYADGPVPVLMLTHSRKFATLLTKRLQAKGYNARQFVGGMSTEEREWKKSAFGHEFDILVATIGTVGEGTDGLQRVCSIEFWLSLEDNRVLNRQAIWRLSRDGQKHTVRRYNFKADASVEVRQAGRLASDQQLLDESLEERAAA